MNIKKFNIEPPKVNISDIPIRHVFRLCESGAIGLIVDKTHYLFLKWSDEYDDYAVGLDSGMLLKKNENSYKAIDMGRLKSIDEITVEQV